MWGNAKKTAQLCRLQAQSPRKTGKTQPAFLILLLATPHEAAASRAAPGHQPPSHLPQPRQGGEQSWQSPWYPLTHPQLVWAGGGGLGAVRDSSVPPSCSWQDPGIAHLSWRQEARWEAVVAVGG